MSSVLQLTHFLDEGYGRVVAFLRVTSSFWVGLAPDLGENADGLAARAVCGRSHGRAEDRAAAAAVESL